MESDHEFITGWEIDEEGKRVIHEGGYVEHNHSGEEPTDSMTVYMDDTKVITGTPWETDLDKYSEERKAGVKTVLVEADTIISNLDEEKIKAMPRAMRRKQMLKTKKELKHLFKELGTHVGN